MMQDEAGEPSDPRIALRVGRVAFCIAAIGAMLSSATHLCFVLAYFGRSFLLLRLVQSPLWDWAVAAPATLFAFLGAMLMVGRGRTSEWQVRAVLLTILYGYFLAYWVADHAEILGFDGLPEAAQPDELRWVVSRLLGLIAIVTLAGLARDEAVGLAWPDADALYRAARGAAAIGLSLWLIYASRQFDSTNPFPPRFRPIADGGTLLISLAMLLARAVAGLFTAVLCAHACVLCSKALARVEIEIRESDPFRSRSEHLVA